MPRRMRYRNKPVVEPTPSAPGWVRDAGTGTLRWHDKNGPTAQVVLAR